MVARRGGASSEQWRGAVLHEEKHGRWRARARETLVAMYGIERGREETTGQICVVKKENGGPTRQLNRLSTHINRASDVPVGHRRTQSRALDAV